jgi:hypothetical protein
VIGPRPGSRPGVLAVIAVAALAAIACGKKGPPLPPLIQLPNAPGEFTAVRRDAGVELRFKVPASNTDGTSPADLGRVDVYAWSVPGTVAADDVVRRGSRIGSVTVNEPPDPDEPEPEEREPPPGTVNQDAIATIRETLPTDAVGDAEYRAYVAVGVSRRGRRGALSARIAMPLVEPPAPPGQPQVTYDEQTITVRWEAVSAVRDAQPPAYAVYRADGSALTPEPVREPLAVDKAIEWEQERCYEVRSVVLVEGARVESAASPGRCVTLHDTFAPAVPEGLVGVGSVGAISLIWTANREADLRGYLVLRAIEPVTELVPVTPEPIPDTNFRDTVPSGARVTYAVQAVDRAGNRSAPSGSIVETAR